MDGTILVGPIDSKYLLKLMILIILIINIILVEHSNPIAWLMN